MALDVKDYHMTNVAFGQKENTEENKNKILVVEKPTRSMIKIPYRSATKNIYLELFGCYHKGNAHRLHHARKIYPFFRLRHCKFLV